MPQTFLYLRAVIIKFYKQFETAFKIAFKFFIGLYLFGAFEALGAPISQLARINAYFSGAALAPAAFCFAVLPTTGAFFLLIFDVALKTSAHIELCAMGFMLQISLLLFYVRLAPKESWFIVFTLIGFHYKIPYIAPMFAGLYFPLTACVPITIGVYLQFLTPRYLSLIQTSQTAGFDFVKYPQTMGDSVKSLIDILSVDYSWVFTAFVFAMVLLIVYVVSHLTMDYSKELAVLFGSLLSAVGLCLVRVITDEGSFSVIFYAALSCVIMLAVTFFDMVLDYKKAERVEFSDDDNYYYVRVIPKLTVKEEKK